MSCQINSIAEKYLMKDWVLRQWKISNILRGATDFIVCDFSNFSLKSLFVHMIRLYNT